MPDLSVKEYGASTEFKRFINTLLIFGRLLGRKPSEYTRLGNCTRLQGVYAPRRRPLMRDEVFSRSNVLGVQFSALMFITAMMGSRQGRHDGFKTG
jgi:hypothetical protein